MNFFLVLELEICLLPLSRPIRGLRSTLSENRIILMINNQLCLISKFSSLYLGMSKRFGESPGVGGISRTGCEGGHEVVDELSVLNSICSSDLAY